MREAWNIHDFQASKVVPSPHAVFCGMVLHRYKNARFLSAQSGSAPRMLSFYVWLCIVTKMQIRCFE